MNDYFEASVAQLIERARQLCGLIPRNLGRDVAALEVVCRNRLERIGARLLALKDDPQMRSRANQQARLRYFRRFRGELEHIEAVAVTVLSRWSEEDYRLNELADRLAKEICYPLPTPVVSCASQRYYHTFPDLRLICVPLAESRFLLHLPDIYHELGHSLLCFETDANIFGYQQKLVEVVNHALGYLAEELDRDSSGLSPDAHSRYITTWMNCWLEWAIEFFCDLFATYTVGPAFVWAHFHLSACIETEPFKVPLWSPSTHPADAARMTVLLHALDRLGFHTERAEIDRRWSDLMRITNATITPEYRRCFPGELLKRVEAKAFEGMGTTGCNLSSPTMEGHCRKLLNEAWKVFWESPNGYVAWERDAIQRLIQTTT